MENGSWLLQVSFSSEKHSRLPHFGPSQAATTADQLRRLVPESVVVQQTGHSVVVTAERSTEIEQTQRVLDTALLQSGLTAEVVLDHRTGPDSQWKSRSTYRAPRTKHGGRVHPDRSLPLLSARAKRRWLAGFVIAAVAGGAYYALEPGVASYQIGFAMVIPLLIVALVWIHHRLWAPLQWAIAIVLAIAGAGGYANFGGTQWWAWGKLAMLPLVLLLYNRVISKSSGRGRPARWYGGPVEGPWGPP